MATKKPGSASIQNNDSSTAIGTKKPKSFATIVAARPIEPNGLSDLLSWFAHALITKTQDQAVAANLIAD
jgi:hypothetical protein